MLRCSFYAHVHLFLRNVNILIKWDVSKFLNFKKNTPPKNPKHTTSTGLLFSHMNPFWHLTPLSLLHLPSPWPVLLICAAPLASTSLWSQGRVFAWPRQHRTNVPHTSSLQGSSFGQADLVIRNPLQTCLCQHLFFRCTSSYPHPELPKHHQELH